MPLSTGQILNNRYRVVRMLGQGGFGAVYRAWDINLERPCAIKENLDASPEAQAQFGREARILANLIHPNLARVIDYFFLPSQGQYFVMDYVEGEDMAQMLDRLGPLPENQALPWIAQVCDAVSYLHSQNPPIIHRDIKPANIKITPEGRAVLVDFGIAKIYDAKLRTTVGARAVTPGFSPPEQYGQGNTDHRTDIYALGATLYTVLTGQTPPDSVDLLAGNVMGPAPAHIINRQVSASIGSALEKAMQLNRTSRFGTMTEFKSALSGGWQRPSGPVLATVLESDPSRSTAAPSVPAAVQYPSASLTPSIPIPMPTAAPRRLPWVWIAVLVGVLCLGATLGGGAIIYALGVRTPVVVTQIVMLPTSTRQPTATSAPSATNVPQATLVPTSPPAATEAPGATPATGGIISPDNAYQVSQVYRFGKGTINSVAWQDSQTVAVATSLGLYQYNIWSFNENFYGSTDGWVTNLIYNPERQLLAAVIDYRVQVWDTYGNVLYWLTDESISSNLAFSPDGRYLAAGSYDNNVLVWDMDDGHTVVIMSGHTETVRYVAFGSDGRTVASGGYDDTAILWDFYTGERLHTLTGHTDDIYSLALSPDGRWLATGGGYNDTVVKVWDVSTGNLLHTLTGHDGAIWRLEFSPDGRYLFSVNYGKLFVWWADSGGLIYSDTDAANAAFSPDSSLLAVGHYNDTMALLDAASGQAIQVADVSISDISAISFSPDGTQVALLTYDSQLSFWNLSNNTMSIPLPDHYSSFESLQLSPDGRTLAASLSKTVMVFDAASAQLMYTLYGHSEYIHDMAFSPDGRTLATGSYDNRVILWDVESGSLLRTLDGHGSDVETVAFSPDGRYVVSGGDDHNAIVWDAQSGDWLVTLSGHTDWVYELAFSPDGRYLATSGAYNDKTIRLWRVSDWQLISTLSGHNDIVYNLAFSPDGQWLASGGGYDDKTVRLWNVGGGYLERTFTDFTSGLAKIIFSSDGSVLYTGSWDGYIRVWNIANGALLYTLENSTGRFCLDPREQILADGDYSNDLRLWNLATGELLIALDGSVGSLNGIVFAGDGSLIITSGYDGTLRWWSIP